MDILLWIDDERDMPPGYTHHARSSSEAIDFLQSIPEEDFLAVVSFDHDLSMDPTEGHRLADDGLMYDDSRRVAEWMVVSNVFPQIVIIHTMNPIGARWLYEIFSHDGPVGLPIVRAPYNPKNYQETGNTGFNMMGKN